MAPIIACERPAWEGGSMTPMMEIAPTMRPPAPSPCTARKAMSCPMSWASPESTEPARNTVTDQTKLPLRPYRSPNLPHRGVEREAVSR